MNNPIPFVSVILPVYNREDLISEAIDSVLAQGHENLEIVVIDDGSSDGTAAAVKKYTGPVRYFYQENTGQTAARNLGIQMAQGEYIAFIDSDDLWPLNKLKNHLACFSILPDTQIVQGLVQIESLDKPGKAEYQATMEQFPHMLTNLGGMVMHRSVFDTIGFNESLKFHEDTEFWLQARENNIKIVLQRKISLVYRLHESNLTKEGDINSLGFLRILSSSIQRRRTLGKEGDLPRIKTFSELRNKPPAHPRERGSDKPVVSVVMVPMGLQNTEVAIQSVLAQSHTPMELILVSSSSDEQGMLRNKFKNNIIRYVLSSNDEIATMLNIGIEQARGDVIAISDFGARWHEDKLKTQIEVLTLNPGTDFVSASSRHILDPEQKYSKKLLDSMAFRQRIGDFLSTLLVRKPVFEQIGEFQSGMFGMEEADWIIRAREANITSVRLHQPLLYRYIEPKDKVSLTIDLEKGVLNAARSSILRKRDR